jgi:hypothetical protein
MTAKLHMQRVFFAPTGHLKAELRTGVFHMWELPNAPK